jgi:hypothetical protein
MTERKRANRVLPERHNRSPELHSSFEDCELAEAQARVRRLRIDNGLKVVFAVYAGILCLTAVAATILCAVDPPGNASGWAIPIGPALGAALATMAGHAPKRK